LSYPHFFVDRAIRDALECGTWTITFDRCAEEVIVFERELTLYQFNLNYLRMLAGEIEECELAVAPFPGANPPVWILGHLAVATDYAGRLLGLEPACPPQWHSQFAPGSNPSALTSPLPTKGDLMAAIEKGHRRVSEVAPHAAQEAMDKPHKVELLKHTNLKTTGDVLAHLMCTHPALHVAQLSACRRKAGKPPIV
jgi:hypothetical protein